MKLLDHFRNMQLRASAYLQPAPYTDRDGEVYNSETRKGKATGFIGDMIYALDGPEQREAQEEAEVIERDADAGAIVRDFIPNSLRTLSPGFSGSKVPVIAIINAVSHFRQSAERLDLIKKVLFYDKAEAYAQLLPILPMLGVDPNAAEVVCLTHDIEAYDKDMLHALIGTMTEAGELAEALEKFMLGDTASLDETNIKEEFGDIFWYAAIAFDKMRTTFPAEMDRVIRKLRARFPAKFTNDNANVRDLAAERAELESAGEPFHGGHRVSPRPTPHKQTSAIVSRIAAKLMHFGDADLQHALRDDNSRATLVSEIRAIAASALSQDETKGNA